MLFIGHKGQGRCKVQGICFFGVFYHIEKSLRSFTLRNGWLLYVLCFVADKKYIPCVKQKKLFLYLSGTSNGFQCFPRKVYLHTRELQSFRASIFAQRCTAKQKSKNKQYVTFLPQPCCIVKTSYFYLLPKRRKRRKKGR